MKFLIPFYYGFSTRTKTLFYKISFIAIIVFPILIVCMFSNHKLLYILPRFILAFISMYCVYEIGYIFNDTYTVRFETNPTYRLHQKERLKVERWANLLIAIRIFIVIISCMGLFYLGVENFNYFTLMLGLLNVAYALHNFYRSKMNILTILLVLIFKYCAIPILFMPLNVYIYYFIGLMFSVPILRTIEFAAKPEYGIKLFSNFKYDRFRVYYYAFFSVLLFLIRGYEYKIINNIFILYLYLLLFRTVCLLSIKTKIIKDARKYNTKVKE